LSDGFKSEFIGYQNNDNDGRKYQHVTNGGKKCNILPNPGKKVDGYVR
jgi:hypothetical protein